MYVKGRTKDGSLEDVLPLISNYFLDGVSLLIAVSALIYAALAFRVSRQALKSAEMTHFAELKMKAHEGRARAERSFLLLKTACHEMQKQWDLHHGSHYPTLGSREFRQNDTRHILEIESEGRKLLAPLGLKQPDLAKFRASDLEDYIRKADHTAIKIEQLVLSLSSPKPIFV